MEAIISGYILFQPSSPTPISYLTPTNRPGGRRNNWSRIQQEGSLPNSTVITLAVPYQGASKDYSSFGTANSLALLAPTMPSLGPIAASLLAGSMSVCLSYNQGSSLECINNNQEGGLIPVPRSFLKDGALAFTVAVLRPFQELTIQVWSGARYLGVSQRFGPCSASKPYEVTVVPSQLCTGNTKWTGQYWNSSGMLQSLEVGKLYTFRLGFRPFLAAADRAGGRGPLANVFVIPVKGRVRIVAS
jgi:hypothetical protein